ncbi:MAG: hypothetical protein M1836_002179 [Candelina mexicana]|nr:MAG: hypothetical protein M1836_002179 [Candelina mexicana]
MTIFRSHCYRSAWSVPGAPQGYFSQNSDSDQCRPGYAETIHIGSAWVVPGAPQGLSFVNTSKKWEQSLQRTMSSVSNLEVLSASSTSTESFTSHDDTLGSIMMVEFITYLCVDTQCSSPCYPTEEQLDAEFGGQIRRTNVNIEGLMTHCARILENKMCKSISVLGTGTYNKVFALLFGDETEILARIKYNHTDVHTATLESEIATIAFLKKHRPKIPVPEIVYWDSSARNPSGRPFILMRRLPGIKIVELPSFEGMGRWVPGISLDSEIRTVLENVARMHAELVRPLPTGISGLASLKIGQLQLNKKAPDYEPGQCHRDTPIEIGPFVCTNYHTRPCLNHIQNGPFNSIWEFFNGLKERSKGQLLLETIPNDDEKREEENEVPNVAPSIETNDTVSCLIDICAILSPEGRKRTLPLNPTSEELCLWHVDLGLWNILVDPRTLEITGVLDWEDAAVLPLVFAASTSASLIPINANQKARYYPDRLAHVPMISDTTQQASDRRHRSPPHKPTSRIAQPRPSFTGSLFYGLGHDVDLATPAEGTDYSMEDAHQVEMTWLRRCYRMTLAGLDPRFGARIWEEHEVFYRLASCLKQSAWRNVLHKEWIRKLAEKAASGGRDGRLEEGQGGKARSVKCTQKGPARVLVEDRDAIHWPPTSESRRREEVWRP